MRGREESYRPEICMLLCFLFLRAFFASPCCVSFDSFFDFLRGFLLRFGDSACMCPSGAGQVWPNLVCWRLRGGEGKGRICWKKEIPMIPHGHREVGVCFGLLGYFSSIEDLSLYYIYWRAWIQAFYHMR